MDLSHYMLVVFSRSSSGQVTGNITKTYSGHILQTHFGKTCIYKPPVPQAVVSTPVQFFCWEGSPSKQVFPCFLFVELVVGLQVSGPCIYV